MFFELASHSDEGLSLVGKHPNIVARWEVTGEQPNEIFHFRWEESNTSASTRRPDSDFGIILLDRVAPDTPATGDFAVEVMGERYPAVRHTKPLYDPDRIKILA